MFKVYVATLFLLHGLSPVPGVTFGYLLATVALFMHTVNGGAWLKAARFRLDDDHFVALFLLGLLPLLLTPQHSGLQAFIYSLLWALTWCLAFWWVREWMLHERVDFHAVSQAAAFGAVALALSIAAEFALANSSGQYLSDFLPFSIREFPEASVLEDGFKRPRAYAAEAGFTAIAFECLIPLALPWAWRGRLRLMLFVLTVAPAYLLLFSAASMTTLLLTLVLALGVSKGWAWALACGAAAAAALATLALNSDDANWLLYEVVFRKFMEFTPGDFAGGADTFSRPEAYVLALTMMAERPWGMGWGAVSQAVADGRDLFGTALRGSGLISVPLEIGASAGVLGLLVYGVIIVRKLRRLTRIDSAAARAGFVCLLWVSLHHGVVLEIWFPMLWFALAFADVVVLRANPATDRAHAWRRPNRRFTSRPHRAATNGLRVG